MYVPNILGTHNRNLKPFHQTSGFCHAPFSLPPTIRRHPLEAETNRFQSRPTRFGDGILARHLGAIATGACITDQLVSFSTPAYNDDEFHEYRTVSGGFVFRAPGRGAAQQ
jgi:hypothetical protein